MQPDLPTSSVSRPRMSTDERAAALLLVDLRQACRCCYCAQSWRWRGAWWRFRRRRPAPSRTARCAPATGRAAVGGRRVADSFWPLPGAIVLALLIGWLSILYGILLTTLVLRFDLRVRRTSGGTTQGRIREGSVLTVMVTSTATYKGETPWPFQRPCPPSPMSP